MKLKLKDTIEMMLSDDKGVRLQAEYIQLEDRKTLLWKFLKKAESGQIEDLNPELFKLGKKQLYFMTQYSKALKERAKLMNIELDNNAKE